MNIKIQEMLNQIDIITKKHGNGIFDKNGRAIDEEITYFNNWIKGMFQKEFPEYVEFARIINGFNYNELYIYSLNRKSKYNIFGLNEILRGDKRSSEYIFFGDNRISLFCLCQNGGRYYTLKKENGIMKQEYETFDEIIIEALKTVL